MTLASAALCMSQTGSRGSVLNEEWSLRLAAGHPLYDTGRQLVLRIPDYVTDRKGEPNFADEGGKLWYDMLRLSRRPETETTQLNLASLAHNLDTWLREHYEIEGRTTNKMGQPKKPHF